jgi:hypothetical protein
MQAIDVYSFGRSRVRHADHENCGVLFAFLLEEVALDDEVEGL